MSKNEAKIVAIIPARGGSKGIPRKNIRLVAGKPLVVYTIEAALKSKYIRKVFVSTEDKEIADICRKYGAEIINRPKKLSGDKVPTQPVVDHAIAYLRQREKYRPDILVLLPPTSPLKTASDIDAAIELFLKNKSDSVVAVSETERPPYWSFRIKGKYLRPLFGPKNFHIQRQDLPVVYSPVGSIFISTPDNLKKYGSFFGKKIIPYILPPERAIDIDKEEDLLLAEIILNKHENN